MFNYLFLMLFALQWFIYASAINHVFLAIGLANFAMLFLLTCNPYWSYDLNTCFANHSRKAMEGKASRITITIMLLYSAPPFIANTVELIVSIFFLSEVHLTDNEIYLKYLNWTIWHKVLSWVVLIGFCLLHTQYNNKLEFFEFMFQRDPCEDRGYEFSFGGASYFIGVFFVLVIIAYFFSRESGMSII